jgi:methylated-DNA-[protein]-cysteine S-methyltransferase
MSKKEINVKNHLPDFNFHIEIEYGQKGIRFVSLHPTSKKGFQWTFSSEKQDQSLEALVNQWFETYCQKKEPSLSLPFDWRGIPPFTQQVLQTVASIPFGSLSTYGQVAHLLERPKSARAVGGACGRNPFLLFIPCHRVLDAKLELRGYSAGGVSIKKQILVFEGSKS